MPTAVHAPARVVVLASGSGTVFEALADAVDATDDVVVVRVVCDQPDAGVIGRAAGRGIETVVVPLGAGDDRHAWNERLADAVGAAAPDLVVSAGFMRIIDDSVLARFADRVVNTHPALLPAFPGAHAVRDALAYGVRVTGCTVHMVDGGVDTGPVVAQRAIEVDVDDDEAGVHERIKQVERHLLPEVVLRMLRRGWTVDGRKVTIP